MIDLKSELERLQNEYDCVEISGLYFSIAGYTKNADSRNNERTLTFKVDKDPPDAYYEDMTIQDFMSNIREGLHNTYEIFRIHNAAVFPSEVWEDGEKLFIWTKCDGCVTMEFYK